MDSDVLVKVEGVSKKFCRDLKRSLWYGVKDISSEILGISPSGELRKKEFWAVNDVSFELRRGECLGLIGHNGAGKSTLLKMLNGLIKPDKGRITMKGRIGALIELGAGFNPILTGRENIYNNGAVLGFSRKEIDKKLEAIIDFAEIDEFIDMPVQNYSSGMKVRLGFAVAAQMEPDILIIDEVLAVGDAGFRIKCFNTISNLSRNSAIIFVSHVMPQIARVSDKILMLKEGKIKYLGDQIGKGIETYFDEFECEEKVVFDDQIKLLEVNISSKLNIVNKIRNGDDVRFKIISKIEIPLKKFKVSVVIIDKEVRQVAVCNSNVFDADNIGQYNIDLQIRNLMLSPGTYSLTIFFYKVEEDIDKEIIGYFRSILEFKVVSESTNDSFAPFLLSGIWETARHV